MGFDIHRLVSGRALFLGGVKIPSGKGLLGHSDGDAVLHAVCDALLGAVGAGDIGSYFPDTDPKWKGVSSRRFVAKAMQLVTQHRLRVSNADVVVLAEQLKLAPYRLTIQRTLAKMLQVTPYQVNLKAKTMERLGPIGEGKAIAAYAVVLLEGAGRRSR